MDAILSVFLLHGEFLKLSEVACSRNDEVARVLSAAEVEFEPNIKVTLRSSVCYVLLYAAMLANKEMSKLSITT